MNKKGLYKLNFYKGREGIVEGLFISNIIDIDHLIKSKKNIYFGSILGKNSDIYGQIEKKHIEFITDDKDVLNIVLKLKLEHGYNPFDYIHYDEEE